MTVLIFLNLTDLMCVCTLALQFTKGHWVGQINPAVKQSPPEEVWGKGAGGSHRLSELIVASCHIDKAAF